jgi:hypothetical protein
MELVGVTEIATMLGVSTQRVSQLTRTTTFPEPAAKLAAGWIWKLEDVEACARESGRL